MKYSKYNMFFLKELLIEYRIANEGQIKGVNEKEINDLESKLKINIPYSYKQFLLLFGRFAGLFSLFEEIEDNNEVFHELIEEDKIDFNLSKNALIIWNFESTFDYIICDGYHDDPAVYRVDLKTKKGVLIEKISENFTKHLRKLILNTDVTEPLFSFTIDENNNIIKY